MYRKGASVQTSLNVITNLLEELKKEGVKTIDVEQLYAVVFSMKEAYNTVKG